MGSVGLEAGAVGDGSPPARCKELEKKNVEKRRKFVKKMERKEAKKKLSQSDQEALDKARRGGMTFSSATSKVPGAPAVVTQSSSGIANAALDEGSGGSAEQMMGCNKRQRAIKRETAAKKAAGTLCGGSYVHPGGGKGAHAEAKIFNNLTNAAKNGALRGGSVLVNIDWRRNVKGGVKASGMPCSSCYKMLCHAVTECKIKIMICDRNNKPAELSEEDCADDENGYEKLKDRIDG